MYVSYSNRGRVVSSSRRKTHVFDYLSSVVVYCLSTPLLCTHTPQTLNVSNLSRKDIKGGPFTTSSRPCCASPGRSQVVLDSQGFPI